MAKTKAFNPKALRTRRGESQVVFWGRLGVTQSGGSRYESDRVMPPPLRILAGIVYLGEKPPAA